MLAYISLYNTVNDYDVLENLITFNFWLIIRKFWIIITHSVYEIHYAQISYSLERLG